MSATASSRLTIVRRLVAADPLVSGELLAVAAERERGNAVVVVVRGDVDRSTAPLLRTCLRESIRHAGPDVVVDLGAVDFFGVAGLVVLAAVRELAEEEEVGFRVVAHRHAVLRPLVASGLIAVLDVHPDVADAVQASAPQRRRWRSGRRRPDHAFRA